MMYQVLIEGQTIPVPETVGKSDQAVKDALKPAFPEIGNAAITRLTKGDVTTITVVKKAGSKGGPLDHLKNCPGGQNPVIVLYEELQTAVAEDPYQLLEMEARIQKTLEAGEKQVQAIQSTKKRLAETKPAPSPFVVAGF